jgi:NRAMP (natural resistance-associated macrophage protein)-like metal ion transporter
MIRKIKRLLKFFGPGFVSGAADNDPAGMATYTQVGAQFGYGQLWTAIFSLPLLIAVQEACARIGAVTGKGLAAVIKENYSRKILYATVILLLITNTISIGADIGAMAEAMRLIVPIPFVITILVFVSIILLLEIFTNYRTYSKYLKWMSCVAFGWYSKSFTE